jgi:hypothetical protein
MAFFLFFERVLHVQHGFEWNSYLTLSSLEFCGISQTLVLYIYKQYCFYP